MPKRTLVVHLAAALALATIACSAPVARNERWTISPISEPMVATSSPIDATDWNAFDGSMLPPLQAAPSAKRFAEGFALGVYGVRHSLGGDFDGTTALVGPVDLIVLPDYDAGLGVGASIGLKTSGGSFDMYLEATDHDGDFGGLDIGGQLVNFGFRGRIIPGRFGSPTQRWQPYFLLGLALNLLTIEDGSTDGVQVGDGDLTGFSLEAGGGGLVNLSEHAALRLDLAYRWTRFGSADGVAGSGTLDDSLNADGVYLGLGVVFTF